MLISIIILFCLQPRNVLLPTLLIIYHGIDGKAAFAIECWQIYSKKKGLEIVFCWFIGVITHLGCW